MEKYQEAALALIRSERANEADFQINQIGSAFEVIVKGKRVCRDIAPEQLRVAVYEQIMEIAIEEA